MVTRDNSNVGSSFGESHNGFIDTFTERVRQANGGNQGQVAFDVGAVILILKVVELDHHLLKFISVEISVGNGKRLETSKQLLALVFGVLGWVSRHDNVLLNYVLEVVVVVLEINHLGEGVKLSATHWHNIFRGTLDNETDNIFVVFQGVGTGHSLAV